MLRNQQQPSQNQKPSIPNHPFISETMHRDTLDRVADVIELLEQMDLSEAMTPSARNGLYWIHRMLTDAVKHVSDGLGVKGAG